MRNATLWLDEEGQAIQAHGGCLLQYRDQWYWYGEDKDADNLIGCGQGDQTPFRGFSCYRSPDLVHWHRMGFALAAEDVQEKEGVPPDVVGERPKVVRDPVTGRFVMWFHLDNRAYTLARAGVAVSDCPEGPFRLAAIRHPNRKDVRDMTLFQDPEGGTWLIHSGDWNKTLYIARLDDRLTDVTGLYAKAFVDQEREAPAALYWKGTYYLLTSGCTGWEPNTLLYGQSRELLCGWKLVADPCEGPGCRRTFGGQGAHLFVAGNRPYLLLDHWNPGRLRLSGYSILPVLVNNGVLTVPWRDEWSGLEPSPLP